MRGTPCSLTLVTLVRLCRKPGSFPHRTARRELARPLRTIHPRLPVATAEPGVAFNEHDAGGVALRPPLGPLSDLGERSPPTCGVASPRLCSCAWSRRLRPTS